MVGQNKWRQRITSCIRLTINLIRLIFVWILVDRQMSKMSVTLMTLKIANATWRRPDPTRPNLTWPKWTEWSDVWRCSSTRASTLFDGSRQRGSAARWIGQPDVRRSRVANADDTLASGSSRSDTGTRRTTRQKRADTHRHPANGDVHMRRLVRSRQHRTPGWSPSVTRYNALSPVSTIRVHIYNTWRRR